MKIFRANYYPDQPHEQQVGWFATEKEAEADIAGCSRGDVTEFEVLEPITPASLASFLNAHTH